MERLPRALLDFRGYSFFFYSKEDNEPVHIHVSKGKPSNNNAKFWIKRDGIELAHNDARIPKKDLKDIYEYLYSNKEDIIYAWYQFFGSDARL
ncbi:MAG: DUF4160 domain-containing protein [Lachnospiraceae bacterium]|nr:DUF4160 domain-containing protein [Lachnospiraceae bacterium]